MSARYYCIEGTEGMGKSTLTQRLADYLTQKYKILKTGEPGSPLSPLSMELRGIMLDAQYKNQMTRTAREFISQAIRSVHLEKYVTPALNTYDFIVQDRGLLSGLAYGSACGNDLNWLINLMNNTRGQKTTGWMIYEDLKIDIEADPQVLDLITKLEKFKMSDEITPDANVYIDQAINSIKYHKILGNQEYNINNNAIPEVKCDLYTKVILLTGNVATGLTRAKQCKKEFSSGDVIESQGVNFMKTVDQKMQDYKKIFDTIEINVDNKSLDQIFEEILKVLNC